MNYLSSGNTSSAASSLLLTGNRSAGAAANNTRESGPEFRAAMNDVANTKKPTRPEPTVDRTTRPDSRPTPAHNKPAERPAAAHGNDPASATQANAADDKVAPTATEKVAAAETESAGETAVATDEAPNEVLLTEMDGEKNSLFAEAGSIGAVSATDFDELQPAPAEETPDTSAALLTPLAPEVSGATPIAGTILPPLSNAAAASSETVMYQSQLAAGGGKATDPTAANALNGLNTGAAELAEPELNLMKGEGELSPDDFKQSLNRLLGTNTAVDNGAQQAEQSLTKLAAGDPTALTNPLQRVSEAQAPNQRSFVVQTGVPVAMGQPRWGQAVGERVLWLAAQNVSSAELRLDPPELGPMQVRVSIHHDQATVSFASPHPLVREALDQSATRLREMFSEQGLNLTEMDVSDQSFARQEAQDEESNGRSGGDSDADADEESLVGVTTDLSRIRLVDHYA